jgi:hypothetical protein
VTKGPRDERCEGTHRHLTHTVLFALLLGGAATIGSAAGGWRVVIGVLVFGVLLAADALGDWLMIVAGLAAAILVLSPDPAAHLASVTGWIGIAVTLGCVMHCLGDAMTLSGCPFLFPISIAGETWYEIRPPRWLRFRTDGRFERGIVFPLCAIGGVLLLPGTSTYLVGVYDLLFTPPPHELSLCGRASRAALSIHIRQLEKPNPTVEKQH